MIVLYVDDEADSEKMVSKFEIIRDSGIEVLPVTRVESVLPTLEEQEENIGLIVLDIIMPPEEYYTLEQTNGGTTTGLTLLQDIRKKYRDIPVVIVSIRRLREAQDIMEKFNVSEYLEKPVSAYVVVDTIRKFMKRS